MRYALTLTQPWATLVVAGAKRIETRSWRTNHRGYLAIHAAAKFPRAAQARCETEPFATALAGAVRGSGVGALRPADLPLGAILGWVYVLACVPIEDVQPSEIERAFGDYSPGRWAWLLEHGQSHPPVPWKGGQRLWRIGGR